jgi:DNA primase
MQISKKLEQKPDYIQYDQILIKRLNQQAIESPRAMRYYSGRLITEDSVKKFALGFSEKQDMVTIPVHSPDGMEIGFVGRSIEGKEFKNTPGLPKSKTLFNLHRVKTSSRVYVVESSFDAIRLDQCGFPAVATLGANVSNIQTDLLQKYFNNVIVIADNDEAGGNMKEKIVERLGSRVSVVKLDKQYKDIGDMTDEEIKNIDESFDKSIAAMLQ